MKLVSMNVFSVAFACLATDVSQGHPAGSLKTQATEIAFQRIKPLRSTKRGFPKSIKALHDYADRLEDQAESGHQRMKIFRDSVSRYASYRHTHYVVGNLQTIHNLTLKTDRLYRRIEVYAKVMKKKKRPTPEWWSRLERMITSLLQQIQDAEDKIESEHEKIRMFRKPSKRRR